MFKLRFVSPTQRFSVPSISQLPLVPFTDPLENPEEYYLVVLFGSVQKFLYKHWQEARDPERTTRKRTGGVNWSTLLETIIPIFTRERLKLVFIETVWVSKISSIGNECWISTIGFSDQSFETHKAISETEHFIPTSVWFILSPIDLVPRCVLSDKWLDRTKRYPLQEVPVTLNNRVRVTSGPCEGSPHWLLAIERSVFRIWNRAGRTLESVTGVALSESFRRNAFNLNSSLNSFSGLRLIRAFLNSEILFNLSCLQKIALWETQSAFWFLLETLHKSNFA